MNDEKTCTIPWHDGTEREVEVGTACKTDAGHLFFADEGGPQHCFEDIGDGTPYTWGEIRIVRIFTEAPEPPVKVNVPTGLGAIVSLTGRSAKPGYVLTRDGWRGLLTGVEYRPDEIANELRLDARVLFEGVDEVAP